MPSFFRFLAGALLAFLSSLSFAQASRTTAPLGDLPVPLQPCQSRETALWGLCRGDGSDAPPVLPQRFAFIGEGPELFPARLSADGALGYIDTQGRWRIEPRYERAYPFREGVAVVSQGHRSAGLDRSGNPVIAWFDGLLYPPSQGLACFVPGGRVEPGMSARLRRTWFGTPGDPPYPAPWWNIEGLAGFMDTAGKVVIEPQFEPRINFVTGGCGFAGSGFAAMRKNGKDGLIDRSGRWVIEPVYEYLGMVFSGNRKVVAVIADRMVEPGWFLDTVERLDGFMGPDGAVRWRETGPPRETPVAGGLARAVLNQMLFPRWQQDLTNEDFSTRMLLAWTASMALALLVLRITWPGRATRPAAALRWLGTLAAAATTLALVFLAGLLSVYASVVLLAAGAGVVAGRRFRGSGRRAGAP